jgi:2-ketocyclohexanecarboxyl-CoA hydrolase
MRLAKGFVQVGSGPQWWVTWFSNRGFLTNGVIDKNEQIRSTIMSKYEDILYDARNAIARIAINRQEKYNAFRGKTCDELIADSAGWDKSIGVIVLTGAGNKAFCTGGDQSAHDGGYDGRGVIGLPVEELQGVIRDVPKPVIARVNGFAIGGGNVLVTCCDLAIASEHAVFGHVGPKVGSVDPGFGTAYLSRVVGEKKAREIWFGSCAVATPLHRRSIWDW